MNCLRSTEICCLFHGVEQKLCPVNAVLISGLHGNGSVFIHSQGGFDSRITETSVIVVDKESQELVQDKLKF